MIFKRSSGILLHISSLPSTGPTGDLGPNAFCFVDFLKQAGQRYWQILPLNPTDPIYGNSPYSSPSAFAGNISFISLDKLVEDGLLTAEMLNSGCGDKRPLLNQAFTRFQQSREQKDFQAFCQEHQRWLEGYTQFCALKKYFQGQPWNQWPDEFRNRDAERMKPILATFRELIDQEKFYQFIFYQQWRQLKSYCAKQGISLIGDMPIYVNFDSADVWQNPELFRLDEQGNPISVSGVPPDYFSETGQRWGNPVYNWQQCEQTHFDWWLRRLKHNLFFCDVLRIDHFRGFVQYWDIPASEKTAVNGRWENVPTDHFFESIRQQFPSLPFIAEDLGIITDDVVDVMNRYQLPGMKVLQFAFGGELKTHPYLPHNYQEQCVVYTGTHDNNTVKGWYAHDATAHEKNNIKAYFGEGFDEHSIHEQFIKLAMCSPAAVAIIPMQDVLGLDREGRMNRPGIAEHNWAWQLQKNQVSKEAAERMLNLTKETSRIVLA